MKAWKRKLRAIGFEGSISAWPDLQGDDLSIEAVPEDRQLKCVQVVFKVGGNDSRTVSELLRDFGATLRAVYEQALDQVFERDFESAVGKAV